MGASNLQINQAPLEWQGIPTYGVELVNMCKSGCSLSNIHLKCGWFSSTNLVNPKIFKRISYDDCLVNNGQPLPSGNIITFKYSNTFKYPLSVASMHCD